MIKINKNLMMDEIPSSLRPPRRKNFHPLNIPRTSKTTHNRRIELINKGAYIDTKPYNSRYKLKDITAKLNILYKNKCAYCEQKIELIHVEHYRPKSIYYWLAHSWDNLIIACFFCNIYKDTNFRINGVKASLTINRANLTNINSLSAICDATEEPDLINPEITDPQGKIEFHKDGNITSQDANFTYTIETCRIDRTYLKDRRMKIIDEFRRDINIALLENKTLPEQRIAIKTIVNKFIIDYKNDENDFLAFRKFAIENWLSSEIKVAKN